MSKYLNKFNLLFKDRYGLMKGHSTDLAIIEVANYVLKVLYNKNPIIGADINLAKAFNTINHNVLIAKFEHQGIRGSAFSWLKSY